LRFLLYVFLSHAGKGIATMGDRREKGKIAHSEWPGIGERYAAGETFASIARSFGCTAPAIRYIVGKHARATDIAAADAVAIPLEGRSTAPVRDAAPPRFPGKAIDQQLRDRVNSDIASFLVAFDAAYEEDSIVNRDALLEATDRLLRAGARTRIAIEEMEEENGRHVDPTQQFYARRIGVSSRR
jgi:hypothetical protein